MIGLVTGTPHDANKGALLVITAGGVGYLITTSRTVKKRALQEKTVTLYTHTALHNNNIALYGFYEQIEYTTFLLLLTVSGIGPKSAIAILDTTTPHSLLANIGRSDVEELVVLGVPKRQAERIIVELRTKINVPDSDVKISDTVAALIALGYDRREIIETIQATSMENVETGEQIKKVLRVMQSKNQDNKE